MELFNIYITLIILIKIAFILLAVSHLYFKFKGETNSPTDKKVVFWKERMEFVFIILMAILLIYLFNPRASRDAKLDYETKILLYLFGFILLITANWDVFIKENPFFKQFQEAV
jgi:hypothetical protein